MLSDPQLHYLDNAATSRVDPAVAQAVSEALTELWANPSSLYDPPLPRRMPLPRPAPAWPKRCTAAAMKSTSRPAAVRATTWP